MPRKVKDSTDLFDRIFGYKSVTVSSNSGKTSASATGWNHKSAKAAATRKLDKKIKNRNR